ncbi:N-carbamoyl-L-amino-acid hydrolase [Paraburkholderia sp. UCT70]|uniref:Zn-dependent hydrolase n=1 Tax=Paraburkholderia sp. UCT70 TaxID=2991068 RepID=UPI003D1F138D
MSISSIPELVQPNADELRAFDALFSASSAIGATPAGGLHRLAASAQDGQVRDLFRIWLDEHGFDVHIDAIGNVFGLVTLTPGAPYVLCGSHLDSQPSAGRFDGVYGVLAGATAIVGIAQRLRASGHRAPCNLAVVDWTNEEGARFQPSLTGSSVFTGAMSLDDAWACEDRQGVTLKSALEQIGYLGDAMLDLPVAAYVEMHVEQASNLEREGLAIGVVRETWAALKWRVRFDGEQNHTGPTPMADRRDALLAAAHTIAAVHAEAVRHGAQMHSSVGRLDVYPNSPNVVPSRTILHIEFRSPSTALLDGTATCFEATLRNIAEQTGTRIEIESRQLRAPLKLHDGLSRLAHDVSLELDLPAGDSVTVAGHDAISMSRVTPTCLLFVPSRGGVSHNEAEYTADADLHNGLRLLSALLERICTESSSYL